MSKKGRPRAAPSVITAQITEARDWLSAEVHVVTRPPGSGVAPVLAWSSRQNNRRKKKR